MSQMLTSEFLKNNWGACDLTRTSLWRKTGNVDKPFIYIGIHGFFLHLDDFRRRRRVMISPVKYPLESEVRKINYSGLFQQQVYIQIWQFATMKENEKIYALHDYTLQSPMVWD
jgi:hypothetical protein